VQRKFHNSCKCWKGTRRSIRDQSGCFWHKDAQQRVQLGRAKV